MALSASLDPREVENLLYMGQELLGLGDDPHVFPLSVRETGLFEEIQNPEILVSGVRRSWLALEAKSLSTVAVPRDGQGAGEAGVLLTEPTTRGIEPTASSPASSLLVTGIVLGQQGFSGAIEI